MCIFMLHTLHGDAYSRRTNIFFTGSLFWVCNSLFWWWLVLGRTSHRQSSTLTCPKHILTRDFIDKHIKIVFGIWSFILGGGLNLILKVESKGEFSQHSEFSHISVKTNKCFKTTTLDYCQLSINCNKQSQSTWSHDDSFNKSVLRAKI